LISLSVLLAASGTNNNAITTTSETVLLGLLDIIFLFLMDGWMDGAQRQNTQVVLIQPSFSKTACGRMYNRSTGSTSRFVQVNTLPARSVSQMLCGIRCCGTAAVWE
jgi:hypothetical protein